MKDNIRINYPPDDVVLLKKADLARVKKQIQKDMITYLEGMAWTGTPLQEKTDALCQIVVDNFKELEIDCERDK